MPPESPMFSYLRIVLLFSTIGVVIAQIPPPSITAAEEARLVRIEAAQQVANEHIAALEKLDLDRRITKMEMKLESIEGWARSIGWALLGLLATLSTWVASTFFRLVVRDQKETQ